MELGIRTITVFLVLAFIRWNECEKFICFLETLMVLNAWQWLHRWFGYVVGENVEERIMNEIRNIEKKILDIFLVAVDTVKATVWFCFEFFRGGNQPPPPQNV